MRKTEQTPATLALQTVVDTIGNFIERSNLMNTGLEDYKKLILQDATLMLFTNHPSFMKVNAAEVTQRLKDNLEKLTNKLIELKHSHPDNTNDLNNIATACQKALEEIQKSSSTGQLQKPNP